MARAKGRKGRSQRQAGFWSRLLEGTGYLLEERWLQEALGVLLLGLAVFVFVALLSFADSDRWALESGRTEDLQNLTGVVGAWCARLVVAATGLAGLLIPLAAAAAGLTLVARGWPERMPLRLIGLVLILLFATGFLHLALDPGSNGITVWGNHLSPGGRLGFWVGSWLVATCGILGGYVLLIAMGLVSVLALTELSLARCGSGLGRVMLGGSRLVGRGGAATGRWSAESFRRWRERRRWQAERRREKRAAAAEQRALERAEREERARRPDIRLEGPPEAEAAKAVPAELEPSRPEAPDWEDEFHPDRNPRIAERAGVQQALIRPPAPKPGAYSVPPLDLLKEGEPVSRQHLREELEANSHRLEEKLADFSIAGRVTQVIPGPVVTTYEFEPAPGVRINKITNLSEDLALAIKASFVPRVAPVMGKSVVGVEIPNKHRESVTLREILASPAFVQHPSKLRLALGKNTTGHPYVADLQVMPHLLIAGTTGSGKSVCINSLLCSMLFTATPEQLRLLLIDPKMLELSMYNRIPHLREPVVTDPRQAPEALEWAVAEMTDRYKTMARLGVRSIDQFNKALQRPSTPLPPETRPLPYLVIIIDELADLMAVSAHAVEDSIQRLAQMGRAAGIHMILATQRPSVDVITGLIKANMPCRLSFQVASRVDSRTILDSMGAEKLLGKGDMLFMPPGSSKTHRLHGCYVSEEEIQRMVDYLDLQPKPSGESSIFQIQQQAAEVARGDFSEQDELYDEAARLVVGTGVASISMIQRRLRVGHARAARLMDMMEQDGLVGPFDGSKPREVLVDRDYFEELDRAKADQEG